VQGERYAGESSSLYLCSRDAAENIQRYNPDSRIIIMLREPVDFLFSLHSQYQRETGENVRDFRTALRIEKERRKGRSIPPRIRAPVLLYYRDRVRYSENVRRYLERFSPGNVKIIIYEDFKKDNIQAYREVLRFLGIDNSFVPRLRTVNPNRTVRYKSLHTFLNNPFLKKLFIMLLPLKIQLRTKRTLDRIFFHDREKKKNNNELKKRLMREFRPEVRKLSRLLNKDLVRRWGYDRIY